MRIRTAPIMQEEISMMPTIVQENSEVILMQRADNIQKALPKTNVKSAFHNQWDIGMGAGIYNYMQPSNIARMSFSLLKRMAASPIISAIIRTRVNQIAIFCTPFNGPVRRGSTPLGYRIKIKNKHEKKYTKTDERILKETIEFFNNMGTLPQRYSEQHPKRDGFETFTRKIIRDSLTYDQGCAEKVKSRSGGVSEIWAVDASTIRIAALKSKNAFVQVVQGMPKAEYMSDEMIFWIRNPRTDIEAMGYGYSEMEDLVATITAQLFADQYNRKMFSQGTTAKGLLNLKGDVNPDDLNDFRAQWKQMTSGMNNVWRTPVLNAKEGAEFVSMGGTNREMEFSKWIEYLVKVASAVFQIDPAEINFDIAKGSSGQKPMFESSQEARMKQSKDKGLRPLLKQYQTMLNEEIISVFNENLELEFIGLDDSTEEETIKLSTQEVAAYKTVDEVREERGLDKLGEENGGNLILNPQYIQAMAAKQQQAVMEAQQGGGIEDYKYEDKGSGNEGLFADEEGIEE